MKTGRVFTLVPVILILGALFVYASGQESPGGRSDCQIGNLNPPVPPSVHGLFTGEEGFAYLVYPDSQCTCIEGGFQLESVSMMLEFEPWMLPVTFWVHGGLLEAVFEPADLCWVPGLELCVSAPIEITITTPGEHTITVPMLGVCDCYPMDDYYFLYIEFLDGFDANLLIDDQPLPCIVYNRKVGFDWIDMYWMKTSGGKGIVFGDIICCEPPIGTEPSTWGAIKSLYR